MAKVKAGEINLEYYVEGSGLPLVIVMGFAGQASSWGEPFLAALRPHFNVIRFSNRGTGESDRPATPTTIRMMADDTAALLDVLGIAQAHVLGISMGGMIAQELALSHAGMVSGLVLGCTTAGGAARSSASPDIQALMLPAPGLSPEEQVRKAWPALCSASFIESGHGFLEAMLRDSLVNPPPIETLAKQMSAIAGFDAQERVSQIRAPTLVVHGDADVLVPPENGRVLHERIAGSEMRVIGGVGHMFFWEKPEESAHVIVEFLGTVPAQTGLKVSA